MVRKGGRTNVLRRIEALELHSVDSSGLVPNSPAWLAFWQEQARLCFAGKEHVPLTVEGLRAVMNADSDDDWDDDPDPEPERHVWNTR